jgi:hypothetical protein
LLCDIVCCLQFHFAMCVMCSQTRLTAYFSDYLLYPLCLLVCSVPFPLTSFMSNCCLKQILWTYRNDMICTYLCMYAKTTSFLCYGYYLLFCTMDHLVIERTSTQSFSVKATYDKCALPCKDGDIFCHKNKDSINQLHNEGISNLLYKFLSSLFYVLSLALADLSTTAYLPMPSLRYTLLPVVSVITSVDRLDYDPWLRSTSTGHTWQK